MQRRVGEMLGEVTQGQRTDTQPLPTGKSLEATARHRYRRIADIAREESAAMNGSPPFVPWRGRL